jgi:diguanylate cyclase (GGDEF)-like protein
MNFNQIIEMVNIGIVIIDKDLTVHLWNRWMATHSNIPAEKIIGKPLFDFFPNINTPRFNRNLKAVLAFGNFSFFSQKLHKYLFPFKTTNVFFSNFEYMQQNCTMGPLRDENNRIHQVFITVQDVTAVAAYEKELLDLNNKDPLTDLFNRRHLRSRLNEEFGKFQRYATSFSLIMFDIDFFKPINDSYGHPCGDYILRAFAALLMSSIRSTDILARYGGEEFCCLLPETTIKPARDLADRIRKKTEESIFTYGKTDLTITVSGGVAEMQRGIATVDALLEKADKALYKAKETGRNKIVTSQ